MSKKIKVMMVEDHPEYRESIQLALETEPDIELIGTHGTAERALRTLLDADKRQFPDVVLLDLHLPGISGLEALNYFKTYSPQSKVIVLTQSDNEEDVLAAISAGAAGYLLKKATLNQITSGILTVYKGGASLDSHIASYLLNQLKLTLPKQQRKIILTDRELEILKLLAEGLLKKEIGVHLDISITTVATHIRHIYEKLEVQNAPAAINKAYKTGIFPSP